MTEREISIELLVGRPVLTRDGTRLGRLQEIRANDQAEITEFLVGQQALLERLSLLGLFRTRKRGYVVRWDQIDLSDLSHPQLTCDVSRLQRL